MHANAVGLKHSRGTVDVDDEARKSVALAVDKTICGIAFATGQPQSTAQVQRRTQTLQPESRVNALVGKRKHTHRDGAYLPVTHGSEVAIRREHTHEGALLGLALNVMDSPREHPGMEAAQRILLAAFEVESCHTMSVFTSSKSCVARRLLISS